MNKQFLSKATNKLDASVLIEASIVPYVKKGNGTLYDVPCTRIAI